MIRWGFPGSLLVVKNSPAIALDVKRCGFDPFIRKIPWRRKLQPPPVFLPRETHGQRSLIAIVHRVERVRHN